MVKFVPLSVPVTAGEFETTRILYAVPKVVPAGIVAEIVPEAVLVSVPILTGVVKLPVAPDNCAVKIFPALNVPVAVKGTLTEAPAQNGLPEIVPVAIVFVAPVIVKFAFEISKKILAEPLTITLQVVEGILGTVMVCVPSLGVFAKRISG